jgi:nanoRNase/pAp phosphatase (c-di-AMP/oligoRNAs hydrolase)
MYNKFSDFLKDKNKICIIQAENPDGDSLGSAIALEYLLKDKEISLYCPVDIPK